MRYFLLLFISAISITNLKGQVLADAFTIEYKECQLENQALGGQLNTVCIFFHEIIGIKE